MSDSSALHGPREDGELKRELRSDLQAHQATRSEEWWEPEAAAEDEPQPDETAGTPEGRARPSAEEAAYELRSELASYLGRAAIPGDRARITAILEENHAADQAVASSVVGHEHRHPAVGEVRDVAARGPAFG